MKKILYIILFAALFASVCGCEAEPNKAVRTGYAMDTFITMTLYGDIADSELECCFSLLEELEADFSRTDPQSLLSELNRTGYVEAGLARGCPF
jgi:thiamine biosynthesis lipoprotein ApbE